MIGVYRIVGINVRIDPMHQEIHKKFLPYQTSNPFDVSISITPNDPYYSATIRPELMEAGKICGLHIDSYVEFRAICREFAKLMPSRDAFLLHGSAVAIDNDCYIFIAISGTGKSTHTRLWRELFADKAIMVNDDKPIIKVNDDGATVYGTPWCGKHCLGNNIAVPLKAICILERGENNSIIEISKEEAYPTLLQQTHRPDDPEATAKTLSLINRLNTKYYRLRCNTDISAAQISYDAMKG